jgi:hypothetical protein
MLEVIKLVGAIVGLATGIFTIWDRWVRGRLLAWVSAIVRTSGTPGSRGLLLQRLCKVLSSLGEFAPVESAISSPSANCRSCSCRAILRGD